MILAIILGVYFNPAIKDPEKLIDKNRKSSFSLYTVVDPNSWITQPNY